MQDLKNYEVPVDKLRKVCTKKEISGKTKLDIPIEMVGQGRVKKALDLALSLGDDFHVIVVTKDIESEVIKDYIRTRIEQKQESKETLALEDYCYAHNFKEPGSPILLTFRPGEGRIFKVRVKTIKKRLEREIPTALSEEGFEKTKAKIQKETKEKWDREVEKFYKEKIQQGWLDKWQKAGWTFILKDTIIADNQTFQFNGKLILAYPISPFDRKLIEKEVFEKLPKETRQSYGESANKFITSDLEEIEKYLQELLTKLSRKLENKLKELKGIICEEVIDEVFKGFLNKYSKHAKAKEFFKDLKNYAKENRDLFLPSSSQQAMTQPGMMNMLLQAGKKEDAFTPFGINLLIDNKETEQVPILISKSPTFSDLFGRIERQLAGPNIELKSDLTMIRPGILHQANGGFVILDLTDILLKEPVFRGLIRVLKEKAIRIRDYSDEYGVSLMAGKVLSPEPVPLNLKVIAVINPEFYYQLLHYPYYKEFIANFKVKAEFDRDIEYTLENIIAYRSYMERYAEEQGFLGINPEASAKIIEFLLRENASQKRLAWDLEKIRNLLRESNFYAVEEGTNKISDRHIKKAIEEKIYRSSLFQERIVRAIEEGMILIDTEGEKVGQINGLVVYHLGDFKPGAPARITVTTFRGEKGLINIEKEAGLSGKTLTKSIEIIKGFFQERYGQNKTLSFEGRICFEQAYGGIEGDSASVAEFIALISSLAQLPLKQNLAVTGSANQKGQVQPIGAVNEKVEGLFDVYKMKGIFPDQGVVIPVQNVQDLMLKEEVIEAVKTGQFRVYAVSNLDQALEIFTGRPAEEINKLVEKRLNKWSRKKKSGLFQFFGIR